MEIIFRTKNDKQLEATEYWMDDTTEQILYGGAKAGGKSYLGCALIFGDALTYPGTHYYIARKELGDLRKYTIPSIHEVFRNWELDIEKYAPFDGQYNIFNLYNGSKVFLVPCDVRPSDPMFERFGSMQMTRGWIEEAGEVAESAQANLWLATGRWMNDKYNLKKKQLITANPKKGWLKRDFVDLWKKNELPQNRRFVPALPTDNPYLTKDYVKSLENEKDIVRRQRYFLGDWDYEEDKDSFVSMDALTDTFSNAISKENKKYLIVDVARYGEDHSVYSFWDGLQLYRIERYNGNSIEETKQKIRDFAVTERIPYSQILIDENGVGGGVVDGLFGVRGFVASSSALPTSAQIRGRLNKTDNPLIPKTNFINLKAQCAFKIAELINEHKVAFSVAQYRDMIIEDLSAQLRYKNVDSDGKLTLRSKDDVKIEIGRSPDIGDTIIMRAWFELKKDFMGEDPRTEQVRQEQAISFTRNKNSQSLNSAR